VKDFIAEMDVADSYKRNLCALKELKCIVVVIEASYYVIEDWVRIEGIYASDRGGWVSTDPHQRHHPTRRGPLIHTTLGGGPAMVTHTHRSNISLSEKDATPITVSAAP
jgi:hypothetical protein